MSGVMDFLKTDEVKSPDQLKKKHIVPGQEEQKNYQIKEEKSVKINRKPIRPQSSSGLAYQMNKKHKHTGDINDKCHDLEKENLTLKEKENLLEREITKMTTKLRRIEELVKAGKNYTDKDFLILQQELEDQFGQIRDENGDLREKVRKLKVISKGLSKNDYVAKRGSSKSKTYNQQSGYKQKIKSSSTLPAYKPTAQHSSLAEELRIQLVKNEKEILKLNQERDRLAHTSSGNVYQDDILRRVREKDEEIRDIRKQMDDMEMNFINKEKIFKESKQYMEELLKQMREQRINNETLKQKNLRLQISTSSVKDLNEQLNTIEKERDQIERSIRTITAEPFFKRENGQSTLKRITDLEEKLFEKEKIYKAIGDQETKKEKEFKELKSHVENLRGERDYLKTENFKIRDKVADNKELNQLTVYQSLFKMDPNKYGQTVSDLSMKQDNVPLWANMDFIERGQEQIDPNNVKALKHEIMKIRHENKDFAAELEKAQNLLHLQRDIEKDNHSYYDQERKRLELVLKSTTLKAEELARRADEKSRQIQEVEKKLGLRETSISPNLSPKKGGTKLDTSQQQLDYLETQSEFSVMTNESEIKIDENVFDFVIQDAEYYYDSFKQVLDEKEMLLHQKTLITFVTVDFYVHDTETSQISEGFSPVYNTQFSFKNKIDDFFVQFLLKNTIKLDFYISKNNSAIHIGRGEVYLRELIDRETIFSENNYKTPVIQKILRIYPIGKGESQQPIGSLRFKMRIRKPIQEALRFFREKNEISTLKAHSTIGGEVDTRSRKKLITIQVLNCKELKVKYGEIAKIAPFFYYQFYTFDERYSITKTGPTPVYDDSQTYEIMFDGKIISYLQKEQLEIILFDDNAPISGIERGAKSQEEQNQDMIGIAKIPLVDLIKGASIHDRFSVKNLKQEVCGMIEVKITVMDLEGGFQQMQTMKAGLGATQYNKQWENDILFRISMKLAAFPVDIDTMFGIFSRGQSTVSKEDFKYTTLNRLNLRKEITEKEMDLLLKANPQICDKEFIDRNDFVMLFSIPVNQAKNELQNQEAMMYQAIQKHQTLSKQMSMHSHNQFNDQDDFSRSQTPMKEFGLHHQQSMHFGEQEVIEILIKAKTQGNMDRLQRLVGSYARNESIQSIDLISALVKEGNISEFEARKVVQMLEVTNKVQLEKFYSLLQRAMSLQQQNSVHLVKFNTLIGSTKGEVIAQKFLALDYNRDGQLNLDGMIAGLLSEEFEGKFRKEDVLEIFKILCRGEFFYYVEYLVQINPALRMLLGSKSSTHSLMRSDTTNTARLTEGQQIKGQLLETKTLAQIEHIQEDPKLNTDSSSTLSLSEFLSKMKGMKVNLDDDELRYLFKILDKTSSGQITYQQFVTEFPEINVSYMIKKIKDIIIGSKVPPESVYEKYTLDKKFHRMTLADFKKFVKFYNERSEEHEIDSLYKHFDQSQKGFITQDEFVNAFGREVKEQQFKIGIEDIIKPLVTKIKKFNVNIAMLFDKYDTSKDGKLTALELSKALKNDMNMTLQDDEIQTIKEYFLNKHRNSDITKMAFVELMETKFDRSFDQDQAKSSLKTLKEKILSMKVNPYEILTPYDTEKTGRLNLRSFKLAIHQLKALNQYAIDNIARFFDKENDGFIAINEFEIAVKGAVLSSNALNTSQASGSLGQSQSFGKTAGSSRRSKWA